VPCHRHGSPREAQSSWYIQTTMQFVVVITVLCGLGLRSPPLAGPWPPRPRPARHKCSRTPLSGTCAHLTMLRPNAQRWAIAQLWIQLRLPAAPQHITTGLARLPLCPLPICAHGLAPRVNLTPMRARTARSIQHRCRRMILGGGMLELSASSIDALPITACNSTGGARRCHGASH